MDNLDKVFSDLRVSDDNLRVLNLMGYLGFNTIHVNYSGGGDSGAVDYVEFFPEPKTNAQKEASRFLNEQFEETLSQPIWDLHGSFADGGGYSVNGAVIWDAVEKTVDINGTHHYYECDDEGEEADCNDEDFSEAVYSLDQHDLQIIEGEDVDEDGSYDCLFAYARLVLKNKFPGEYHNRIVAAAIAGDSSAKEYVSWSEKN